MKQALLIASLISLASCSAQESSSDATEQQAKVVTEADLEFYPMLERAYKAKPENLSRAYALMKNGAAGKDWLLTVHGWPDNRSVCEEIIAPYNARPESSVLPGAYYCEEINASFTYDPNAPD